jgi:catechol 2,3-dioxygenase-like lactoylglutathione lyase family enzyme
MKRVNFRHALTLSLSCLLATACGGGDDEPVAAAPTEIDACAALAAPVPASGASAPVSTTGAYLCGAGVGVNNLEASVSFYKAVFGMRELARIQRADRNEVVLDSADSRGSRLVLMNFTDGSVRNYSQNPGKIVFYVRDATLLETIRTAFVTAGASKPRPPFTSLGSTISFGRDLDGNLIEIATSSSATHSYLSAIGVGVSNLSQARAFYVDTLDMMADARIRLSPSLPVGFIPVPALPAIAASGTEPDYPAIPAYNEYILLSKAGRGSAVVIMNHPAPAVMNYTNNPIKLTLRVNDPTAYAQRITSAAVPGATVTRAPAPATDLGGAVVGQATDANGTQLEILNSPN